MFTARFGDEATLFRLAGQLEAGAPVARSAAADLGLMTVGAPGRSARGFDMTGGWSYTTPVRARGQGGQRMTRVRAMGLGIGFLLAIPAVAAVLNANVSGDWTLTVVEPTHGCTWVGPLAVVQTGNMFTGSATLNLVPGSSDPCPSSISGTVSGHHRWLHDQVWCGHGWSGTANFDGAVGSDELSASGAWTIPGVFDGTWHAERVVGVRAPALSAPGSPRSWCFCSSPVCTCYGAAPPDPGDRSALGRKRDALVTVHVAHVHAGAVHLVNAVRKISSCEVGN